MTKPRKVPMREEDAAAIADTFMAYHYGQNPTIGGRDCVWKRSDVSLNDERLWCVIYQPFFLDHPGATMDGAEVIVFVDPYSRKAMSWQQRFEAGLRQWPPSDDEV